MIKLRLRALLLQSTAITPILAAHDMNDLLIASWIPKPMYVSSEDGVIVFDAPNVRYPFVDFGEPVEVAQ